MTHKHSLVLEEAKPRKSRKRAMAGIAGLLAAGMLSGSAFAAPVTIRMTDDDTFSPATKQVRRGQVVRWANRSGSLHSVTATSSNWGTDRDVDEGSAFSRRFTRVGRYRYICKYHDGMSGLIRVVR
jgi:plastocyanin